MKRFEEIKKLHEHFACGHEEINEIIYYTIEKVGEEND